MKIKTSIKPISSMAAIALLTFAFLNCGEKIIGPPTREQKLDPTSLKDSADTAHYMHSLYKGKWTLVKWIVVQPGIDTLDKTIPVTSHIFGDSTTLIEVAGQENSAHATMHYKVTRDSICSSTYGGNFLDWSCTSHAFKGKDTLDYSDSLDTEIWVRAK